MLISQEDSVCNKAGSQTNKISITGNIIPSNWYHNLLRPCGKSDTTAIAILSELVFLHRYNGSTEFQLNFSYFARKFNFGLSQVKDAVVRLERLYLLKRDLRTVVIHGRTFVNEMFLILNIKNVLKLNPHNKTSDHNDLYESPHEVKKFPLANRNEGTSSLEFSSDNIDKKEKNKKSRSNFSLNNSLVEKTQAAVIATLHRQRFSFESFYPLVQLDIDNLGHLADREFSGNAINEILLSLSKKLPEHSFPHKKAFINYIAYKFLSSASFPEQGESLKSEVFKISLQTTIELNDLQQRLILAQVQSVYGDHIKCLDITSSQNTAITKSSFKQLKDPLKKEPQIFERIWGKIRQGLIDYYGSGGNAMDNAWFGKLTAEVDSNAKKLTLKAPTKFIKDWVQSNYAHLIDNLCRLHNYSLEGVLAV